MINHKLKVSGSKVKVTGRGIWYSNLDPEL